MLVAVGAIAFPDITYIPLLANPFPQRKAE